MTGNGIEVARFVQTNGVAVFRPIVDKPGEYEAKEYFEVSGNQRRKGHWIALDAFSASAIVAVHDALNEANRKRFAKLPLVKMAHVSFKLVK